MKPKITNPPQALFGMLWGVWFGAMTRDVLTSNSISTSWGIFSLVPVVKIIYIFAALIVLATVVALIIKAQDAIYEYREVWKKSFSDGILQTLDLLKKGGLPLIPLYGFLYTVNRVFNDATDPYLLAFGAMVPTVWLSLEAFLVWAGWIEVGGINE